MESFPADWSARVDRWRAWATDALVLAGALAIPLVFFRDPSDMFRLPKAMVLRAEAIAIVSVTLGAYLLGAPLPRPKWRDPWLFLPLGAFAIFLLLTLTSTNRLISTGALGSAAATAIVFFATLSAARRRGWILLVVPLAAAVANAILVIIEELNLWMPFGTQSGIPHHLQCDALLGNPNEIGGYLGAAALACLAARWSWRSLAIGAILCAGLVASQTLTAIAAFAAAAFLMMAISSWKTAIRTAVVAFIAAAILVALVGPLRARAANVARWVHKGQYNALVTERFTPFLAAWSMFVEHPLTGVGPGTFAWHYYDYKIGVEERHPSLRNAYNRGVNFGEVHNDHLQVLAEGGILGYGAFLALIGALAYITFTVPADAPNPRQRFARSLALPLAAFWIVLSIAQFPMETTVVRSLLVYLAVLCVGWRNS